MPDYSTYSDSKLLTLIREPKPVCDEAFREIYFRYSNSLNTFCRNKVGNSKKSEDIFQDTWIEFIISAKKNESISRIQPYLLEIAHKLICKLKEKNNGENEIILTKKFKEIYGLINTLDFQPSLENIELVSIIRFAINNLDDKYQEVYIMKQFNEMTYKEIAGLLGKTEDCVRQRFSRATKMLKEILKPFIDEFNQL